MFTLVDIAKKSCKGLNPFPYPPSVHEGSNCSASSPTLGTDHLSNCSQSGVYIVVSH